jgi:transposase
LEDDVTSEATRNETSVDAAALYMAMELSERTWKLLLGTPAHGKLIERNVTGGDLEALWREIAAGKQKLGLPPDARVASCQEAGRDGFWLHRALEAHGVESLVVDSSSIEVPRKKRRAKTDRIDVRKLYGLLARHMRGEKRVWSVVRVPDPQTEDVRRLSRAIDRLKKERSTHRTRMKTLLVTQGVKVERAGGRFWEERLKELRLWNGEPLPANLVTELVLEGERLALVESQLGQLKAERDALVASKREPIGIAAGRLAALCGVAGESSFVFAAEVFGWRTFDNRGQVGAAVGLTPTPYASGNDAREQGISKGGNPRMRAMMVEIAWCWLKHQPQSALSRWFRARFAAAGGRARKSAIVALARKLLVALWRYLAHGVAPEGARFKAGAAA